MGLCAICKESRDAIRSTLKELQTYNYLVKASIDKFDDGDTEKSILKYYYDLMAYNQTPSVFDGYETNAVKLLKEIPNLNLGLYLREQPNLTLQKDIYKADISINDIKYTYMYNQKLKTKLYDTTRIITETR